jgi:aspartokinase/homoserine dehydrogenase 1
MDTTDPSPHTNGTAPAVTAVDDDASPGATRAVDLYLAGIGSVGRALLDQVANRPDAPLSLHLAGACTSRRAYWLDADTPPSALLQRRIPYEATDWNQILADLTSDRTRPLIFIDATGSPDVARKYPALLQQGIHVVTPSKHANTFEQSYFDELHRLAHTHRASYRYETTVGAGLPVVQSVQDLVATGDEVHTIRGAASGTLTFIFSQLDDGVSFSEAVRTAAERGYTEPDVRDDLSGEDVARKFLILARSAGLRVERGHLAVESLVPPRLQDLDRPAVLDQLSTLDAGWQRRVESAHRQDWVLRYVGHLERGRITVGVRALPRDSAFGRLQGTDNLFAITTDRYADAPLRIQGPGAGPQVTAAGVLADVLKAARTALS